MQKKGACEGLFQTKINARRGYGGDQGNRWRRLHNKRMILFILPVAGDRFRFFVTPLHLGGMHVKEHDERRAHHILLLEGVKGYKTLSRDDGHARLNMIIKYLEKNGHNRIDCHNFTS